MNHIGEFPLKAGEEESRRPYMCIICRSHIAGSRDPRRSVIASRRVIWTLLKYFFFCIFRYVAICAQYVHARPERIPMLA